MALFSFSLQFSVVLAIPRVEFILTTKELNHKLVNLMETDFNY